MKLAIGLSSKIRISMLFLVYLSVLILKGACQTCSSDCLAGCNSTGAGKCDICDNGYGLTSNGTCGRCSINCQICKKTGADKCDMCNSGYGPTLTNSCEPCSSNCAAGCYLTGAGKCDSCNPGYGPTPSGSCAFCSLYCSAGCNLTGAGHCDKCDLDFGLTPTNSCALCSANCNKTVGCKISDTCDMCDTGYELNSNQTCSVKTTTPIAATTTITTTAAAATTTTTTAATTTTTTAAATTTTAQVSSITPTNGQTVSDYSRPTITGQTGSTTSFGTTSFGISISGEARPTTISGGGNGSLTWPILFTILMLVFGGLIITLTVLYCWWRRFTTLPQRPIYGRSIMNSTNPNQNDMIRVQQDNGIRKRN